MSDLNSRDTNTEQLGRLLDTLAILEEAKAALKAHAAQFLADRPELVRGSETLTLDDRIANTVSNRAIIASTYGDQRSIEAPEQMIRGGVAVAAGADTWSTLAHLANNAMETAHTTAGQYRTQLNTPLGPDASSRPIARLFEAVQDAEPAPRSLLGDLVHKPPQAVEPEPERPKGKSR